MVAARPEEKRDTFFSTFTLYCTRSPQFSPDFKRLYSQSLLKIFGITEGLLPEGPAIEPRISNL